MGCDNITTTTSVMGGQNSEATEATKPCKVFNLLIQMSVEICCYPAPAHNVANHSLSTSTIQKLKTAAIRDIKYQISNIKSCSSLLLNEPSNWTF